MADMLKFRKGTYAQINAADKVAGTIYIAKDEKAMYVDIDASTRIRIGDFIRVDSVDGITPPYSTSALYYVEADNALLKYDGSTWKQVNGTDDIIDRLDTVENDISSLKSTVGNSTSGLVKDVADNTSAINNLQTTVSTHTNEIEALQAALGLGEGDEADGTLAGSVAQLRLDLTDLETEVHGEDGNGGMVATLADHTSRIGNLETASANHVTKTEAEAFAKTDDIQGTLNKVDTEGNVSTAISTAVAAEKSRAEEAETDLSDRIAAVKSTADNAVSNDAFEAFKTSNSTAINNAKTTAISEATGTANQYTNEQIAAEVTRANGAYAPKTLVDTVANHTSTLNTLTGTADTEGSVAWAKKAADGANDNAETRLLKSEFETFKTSNTNAIAEAKQAGTNAANTANTNAEAITGLKSRIEDIEKDYITETELENVQTALETDIATKINAANAMTFKEDVGSAADITNIEEAGVSIGDTYVASGPFSFTSNATTINCKAGDLLIAGGIEGDDGKIITVEWHHVKTGYDASLDQKLSGSDNAIKLSTGIGGTGTQVAFTASGSTSVSVANNTVTIGMVWEDFPNS